MLPCDKGSDNLDLGQVVLINFCIENFKSFKGIEEFTMIASESPEGPASEFLCYQDDRIIFAGNPQYRLLPVTAIFGANSYGKSTFVEALRLIQRLVLEPAKEGAELPVSPFFIDPKSRILPTSFELNILSAGAEYEIYIKLDSSKIIEERVSIVKGEYVKDMYHRKDDLIVSEDFDHGGKIRLALESCSGNELLLSNQILHEMGDFKPIHRWFRDTLLIVSTDTKFIHANHSNDLTAQIGEALSLLDMGAHSTQVVPSTLCSAQLTQAEVNKLRKMIEQKGNIYFMNPEAGMFVVTMRNRKISVNQIKIVKLDSSGNKFCADLREESNGTQRLLQLLPALLQLGKADQSKVVIIDDFDKNLHDDMTNRLVEYHLNSLGERVNSQLIFSTHDTELIDNCILRNDEIWIIQKNHPGISQLVCLSEFQGVETDMTFQQLYKRHNLGGTPRIHLVSSNQLAAKAAGIQTQFQNHLQ